MGDPFLISGGSYDPLFVLSVLKFYNEVFDMGFISSAYIWWTFLIFGIFFAFCTKEAVLFIYIIGTLLFFKFLLEFKKFYWKVVLVSDVLQSESAIPSARCAMVKSRYVRYIAIDSLLYPGYLHINKQTKSKYFNLL